MTTWLSRWRAWTVSSTERTRFCSISSRRRIQDVLHQRRSGSPSPRSDRRTPLRLTDGHALVIQSTHRPNSPMSGLRTDLRSEGTRPTRGGQQSAHRYRVQPGCNQSAVPQMIKCGRGGNDEKIDPLSVSAWATGHRMATPPHPCEALTGRMVQPLGPAGQTTQE
jgi:hypothetical protein